MCLLRWADIVDQVRSIEGWLLEGQDRWLFETTQAMPNHASILEIGGYLGWSTSALGYGCIGTGKRVYCIDTFCGNDVDFIPGRDFEGGDFLRRWQENMDRCGLTGYTVPLVGKSSDYYHAWNKPIHFLFVDGSHQYEDVFHDIGMFYEQVVPGGVVAVHDVHPEWPGPWRAWHELSGTILENTWTVQDTLAYGLKPYRV